MFNHMRETLAKEANSLLVVGGGASALFLCGGYYFSMKERYERQVEALVFQLEKERQSRELHDELMVQKLNHERDQQALAILHLRRDTEKLVYQAQHEHDKLLFDLCFHGDYDKFRQDVGETIGSVTGGDTRVPDFVGQLVERSVAAEVRSHVSSEKQPDYAEAARLDTAGTEKKPVNVRVKDTTGKVIASLSVPTGMSIGDVKYEIEDRTFIAPGRQRIYFKGRHLQDGPTLGDYEITDGSSIHLKFLEGSSVIAHAPMLQTARTATRLSDRVRCLLVANAAALSVLWGRGGGSTSSGINSGGASGAGEGAQPSSLLAFAGTIDSSARHRHVVGDVVRPIQLEDFVSAVRRVTPQLTDADARFVFRLLDQDSSGYISARAWRGFMQELKSNDDKASGRK
jgi:hypothetical protein